MTNLHSTTEKVGKIVTQIYHFKSGNKKTFDGIMTNTIKDGTFTKMMRTNGDMLSVNGKEIEIIETINENKENEK